MKKLSLSELSVTSFTTGKKEEVRGGRNTDFMNCVSDPYSGCNTDFGWCTANADCTVNCTYLC